MNTDAIKKRFEKLVSLNIEGIASKKENSELWNILRQHANLKAEYFQARDMHYLLTVGCDPSASEVAFANRVKDSLRERRLKETNLLGSVQNRLIKVAQKNKKRQSAYPTLKIAASILMIFGCTALLVILFFQTQTHLPEISKSDKTYLDWNYDPEIVELKKDITTFYGSLTLITYLYAGSENEIIKKIEKINEMINRSEKLWP